MLPILLVVLAVVLLVLSGMITKNAQVAVDSDVARANQGIYTIAIIFLTVGAMMLALNGSVDLAAHKTVALAFTGMLGIVLLALAAVIVNKTSGKAKDAAVGVLVLGIVFIVASGAIVAYDNKSKFMYRRHRFACY